MAKKSNVTINKDVDLDAIDAQLDQAMERLAESTDKVVDILESYSDEEEEVPQQLDIAEETEGETPQDLPEENQQSEEESQQQSKPTE